MFDTLKYSKILEAVGVPRDQAEAHVTIVSEFLEDELVTKQEFRQEMAKVETEFTKVRGEIRELKNEVEKLEYRLVIKLTAITGTLITFAIGSTAAIVKLL